MLKEALPLVLSLALFYLILTADISTNLKVFLSLALLYAYGTYAQRRYLFDGGHGLILYKNRDVVALIRSLAHRIPLDRLADLFLIVSFGLLALPALEGGWKRKALLYLGAVVMLTVIGLLYPFSFLFLSSALEVDSTSSPSVPIFYAAGVGGAATLSVISGAVATLGEIWDKIQGAGEAKAKATLLLPGINLPLLEGLLALALVLIFHEFAHGVVAVRENIRLSSAGLLFFGFLPVGGFVEPDERALRRAPRLARLRVYVAGTMANFLAAIGAFLLLLLFAYATAPLAKEGCLVVGGVLEKGTFIYAQGGSCVNAAPNQTVVLKTDRGDIVLKADEEGKVGLYVLRCSKEGFLRYYGNGLDFIYNFLSLLFSLNMVVAVVNLLPAFVFDGARIVEELLPPTAAKALNAVTLAALVVLFLPALL